MRAKKRLGQHFLHDPAVLRRLVGAVAPAPADRMVEIGPGRGALTRLLLEQLDRLDVVEIDRELAASLPDNVRNSEKLVVHTADALDFDFGASPRVRALCASSAICRTTYRRRSCFICSGFATRSGTCT